MNHLALLAARAVPRGILIAFLATATASPAQEIVIGKVDVYTENRGWNEAGLSPRHLIFVAATVVPSDYPTLVYAEQNGVRQPLSFVAGPLSPDLYMHWLDFDPAFAGSWRIVAERGDAKRATARTPMLAKPRKVALVENVRVEDGGAQPKLTWELPDLAPLDIDRIRVGVRGGKRIHGRFLSVVYVSESLPTSTTSFTIPSGVLAVGEPYIFQVMLEELEGDELRNRSLTFSEPYTVPR